MRLTDRDGTTTTINEVLRDGLVIRRRYTSSLAPTFTQTDIIRLISPLDARSLQNRWPWTIISIQVQ